MNKRTKTRPNSLDLELLQYLFEFMEINRFSPTARQIGAAMGYSGTNATAKIRTLVKYGYLERGTGINKYKVTHLGLAALQEPHT